MMAARWMSAFSAMLLLAVCIVSAYAAEAIEPHSLYEAKCRGCHSEHAADLARLKLATVKDKLQVKRTGAPLDSLLRKHHGVTLSAAETDALRTLFKSGIRWAGVFQHRCARCHDKGVTFARSALTSANGRIKAIKSGRDVDDYLSAGHGEASPADVQTLLEMFRYQLETAPK